MSMDGKLSDADGTRVESSLRAAIKLNPTFSPAYDRLAMFYAMKRTNLDEAHTLTLLAVQNDPGNFAYRINAANVLLLMDRPGDAITVARKATNLAKSLSEVTAAQNLIDAAEKFQAARKQVDEANAHLTADLQNSVTQNGVTAAPGSGQPDDEEAPPPPALRHRDEAPQGPHRVVEGRVAEVKCTAPSLMDLKMEDRTLVLHTENYFSLPYNATNFTPTGELHPCTDLKGMHVRITYRPADPSEGQILAVDIRK
jgi:hypothetical protein